MACAALSVDRQPATARRHTLSGRVKTPWQHAADLLAEAAWSSLRGEGRPGTVRFLTPRMTVSVWVMRGSANLILPRRSEKHVRHFDENSENPQVETSSSATECGNLQCCCALLSSSHGSRAEPTAAVRRVDVAVGWGGGARAEALTPPARVTPLPRRQDTGRRRFAAGLLGHAVRPRNRRSVPAAQPPPRRWPSPNRRVQSAVR
jgi:hypothetical protein